MTGLSVTISTEGVVLAAEFVIDRAVGPLHNTPTHTPLLPASATGVARRIAVRIPLVLNAPNIAPLGVARVILTRWRNATI